MTSHGAAPANNPLKMIVLNTYCGRMILALGQFFRTEGTDAC